METMSLSNASSDMRLAVLFCTPILGAKSSHYEFPTDAKWNGDGSPQITIFTKEGPEAGLVV